MTGCLHRRAGAWGALLGTMALLGCPPSPSPPVSPPGSDEPGILAEAPDDYDLDPLYPWPSTLSGTGLFDNMETEELGTGVIPYEVAWPLWSDGAEKERFFSLPAGARIDSSDPDHWSFPTGTKAWKHFYVDDVRIETRFIERLDDGWSWVSYFWRGDGSDADAVPEGVVNANRTPHNIPDTDDCARCHLGEGLLGLGAIQLGADSSSQTLDWLEENELLSHPIEEDTAVPGEGAAREVLGYLHGNCGGCHTDSYPAALMYDLRLRVDVGLETPEDTKLYQTAVDAPTRHATSTEYAVVPGDPDASQIYERMGLRDYLAMPPVGTEQVDLDAHDLVRQWILELPPSAANSAVAEEPGLGP